MTILNNLKKLTKEEATKNIILGLDKNKEEIEEEIQYYKEEGRDAIEVVKIYVSDLVCDIEIKDIDGMNLDFVFTLEDIQKIANDYLLTL